MGSTCMFPIVRTRFVVLMLWCVRDKSVNFAARFAVTVATATAIATATALSRARDASIPVPSLGRSLCLFIFLAVIIGPSAQAISYFDGANLNIAVLNFYTTRTAIY